MRRSVLFGLCIVLLLSISAASIAVSIGEGPVELDPDETVNITPVNSTETYEVPEATVLGALNASSVLGMFEFQVAEDLPPEEGNLSILSIAGIENELVNETPNNWTYWVNGEQGTTGPAVTNVTDGDNVTFSYGPPTHTLEDAAYTLVLNVSVIGAVVTPTPTVNVTPTPGENVTPTPTVNVTPTPGENVTPTPGENVTPSVNVSDQPIVNATVIVDNATINQTGWADIHADLNGTPGPIIGYSPISEGVNENVTVAIEVEDATPVLYAMLHVDEGEPGVHEFPGPDVPILVNGSPVQQAFNVTGGLPPVNVTPTPTVNVTPTPTVNVTPTPTVNVTPTPTVNVTPTPTVNVTPTPTVNVTPTPTVNVTPTPTVNVTPTPTVNVTPTPTVNVTPTPVPPGETVDLQLYEGWNFISIPRQLSVGNDTAAAVFADVDTDGRPIYTYTPAGGFEPLGENETLMVLEGYWVYSTEETTVDLMLSTNPVRSPAVKTLSPGWNAIGYSDLTERSADNALTSVEDIWVYVVGYDAEDQSYQPALINNVTGAQGENQRLSPTEGYWLFVREDGRLAAISA